MREIDRQNLLNLIRYLQENPDLLEQLKTVLGTNSITFPNEININVRNK